MLLLSILWPGLVGAVLLGLGIGWMAGMPRARATPFGLVAAAILLAATASAGIVPGRAGLWLESGAMLLAAYLAGCALGASARGTAPAASVEPKSV